MEHRLVWEHHHGPVPEGLSIHHRKHDPLDNRIENLEIVDHLAHKRIHSGCELRDDGWWKPCRKCGELKPIGDYYERKDGVSAWCKPCHIARVVERKRERRASRPQV